MINVEKLRQLSAEIHEIAVQHGWHEKEQSDETYMCLVMTEVAEAVEADRKGLYGRTDEFKDEYERKAALFGDYWFKDWYKQEVKPTREAEMADIVIRMLDYVYEKWGEEFFDCFFEVDEYAEPYKGTTFAEAAWDFVDSGIGWWSDEISWCLNYVYAWAAQLDFDLDWHIERKIEYNRMRSYHHGGKAY